MGRRKKDATRIEPVDDEPETTDDEGTLARDVEALKASGLKGEPVAPVEPGSDLAEPAPPSGTAPKKTRYLACKLTPKERGKLSASLTKDLAKLDDLDASMTAAKERVKLLREEQDLVISSARGKGRELRDGRVFRDVACEEREGVEIGDVPADKVPRLGIVTFRLDTMEPIDWREFATSDRQGSLFDETRQAI